MTEKKHLVVICGFFYPKPSPTGLCAKRFVELLHEYYYIDVICASTNGTDETVRSTDGYRIYTLSGGVGKKEYWAKKPLKMIIHQVGRVQIKTLVLGNQDWYRKRVIHCLEQINNSNTIDTLFSICSPFAAHVAAHQFVARHGRIHWCAYTVDPYSTSDRIRPFWCSHRRLERIEKRAIGYADYVLLSEEVYRNRPGLCRYNDKYEALPYILPEFLHLQNDGNVFNREEVNCVYAGRFYQDIRNPKPLLELFSRIPNPRIKLHLFCSGCEDIVDEYAFRSASIVKHGTVPHQEIERIFSAADVLVTVANTTNEFLPSKTFEYISTCKPILSIDLFSTDNELNKYPIVLRVGKVNEEAIVSVQHFLINSKGKRAEPREIKIAYEKNSKEEVKKILLRALHS